VALGPRQSTGSTLFFSSIGPLLAPDRCSEAEFLLVLWLRRAAASYFCVIKRDLWFATLDPDVRLTCLSGGFLFPACISPDHLRFFFFFDSPGSWRWSVVLPSLNAHPLGFSPSPVLGFLVGFQNLTTSESPQSGPLRDLLVFSSRDSSLFLVWSGEVTDYSESPSSFGCDRPCI